jgi:uncharacterized repeat protein (TIGR03803 family)
MRVSSLVIVGIFLYLPGCGGGGGGGGTAQIQTLYTFGSNSTDAMGPLGSGTLLQGSDGSFYGVTCNGGIGGGGTAGNYTGNGTVFKITPTGEETVLYLFAGGADSACPKVLIQGSDGNFYGVALGSTAFGTVFKLTPEGVETILHSFTAADGANPVGLVQGSDGNFYGMTGSGTSHNVVFKLTPAGVFTVLYSFAVGTDGLGTPAGQLLQGSDGNLYGTDPFGGPASCGNVFKVTPEGVETTLHTFAGSDGCAPVGGLIQGSDGNIYGTTRGGGQPPPGETAGTVFKITPEGALTSLYAFSGSGNILAGLVQASDGNFYGTTTGGGTNGVGTAFQITPAGVLTVLCSFATSSGAPLGAQPSTNLVQGSDGNLYGATFEGGAYNRGYLFKVVLN